MNDKYVAVIFFFGMGVCPLLAGLVFLWGLGQISTITCTRLEATHVDCHVARAFLGVIPSEDFTVTRVTGTELTTNCEDSSCTYGVNLLTDETMEPLTNMSTSDLDNAEAEKKQVDEFLNNTEATSIEYSSGPAWIGMVLTLPFIALGGYVITRGYRAFFPQILGDETGVLPKPDKE